VQELNASAEQSPTIVIAIFNLPITVKLSAPNALGSIDTEFGLVLVSCEFVDRSRLPNTTAIHEITRTKLKR
jgi:hypothetical protein